jgi:hypothetical protein
VVNPELNTENSLIFKINIFSMNKNTILAFETSKVIEALCSFSLRKVKK